MLNSGIMKSFLASGIILLAISGQLKAQAARHPSDPVIQEIHQTLSLAQVEGLVPYLGNEVEMNINGNKSICPKDQAAIILLDFLAHNKPSHFQMVNSVSASNNQSLVSGRLSSQHGGNPVKVFIVMNKEQGKYQIESLGLSHE